MKTWRYKDKYVTELGGYIIAEVTDDFDGPMIAAAPDLYAACQAAHRILTQIVDGDIDAYTFMEADKTLNIVQDALDKAEGNE